MRRSPLKARRGFTLVELLVAIVILNVGLLALVGGSAALVRRHSAIRARGAAMRAAEAGLARLALSPCRVSSGSSARPDGGSETWRVESQGHGVRDISDSVGYTTGDGQRAVVLHSRVTC